MTILLYIFNLLTVALLISGCSHKQTVESHPKNPRYEIIKPPVRFAPSKKNLAKMIKQLQGAPYVWAEEGPDKFDCSGFTYYLYGSMGIEIPRVSREQAKVGKKVRLEELQYGDLLFFATDKRNRRRISHVGVYLGNGWFTHASTTQKKVVYTNLYDSPYYLKRLRICRRYLPEKSTRSDTQTTKFSLAQSDYSTANKTKKALILPEKIGKFHPAQYNKAQTYIQIGSFVQTTIPTTIQKIKNLNYRYRLIRYIQNNQNTAKLLIGPFANKSEANLHLPRIRNTLASDAFIVEVRT